MTVSKLGRQRKKKSVFGRGLEEGEKNEQVEGTQETFSQLPTGMADAGPSALVKTH